MNRCETCKFWQPHEFAESPMRVCQSSKVVETGPWDGEDDSLVYSYDEGGYFQTGPKFGCVHHEPKEVYDER